MLQAAQPAASGVLRAGVGLRGSVACLGRRELASGRRGELLSQVLAGERVGLEILLGRLHGFRVPVDVQAVDRRGRVVGRIPTTGRGVELVNESLLGKCGCLRVLLGAIDCLLLSRAQTGRGRG